MDLGYYRNIYYYFIWIGQSNSKKLANRVKICVEQNERDFIRYNLIDLIEEHNYFTKITADINKTFRIIIFSLYILVIPIFVMGIYMIHHKNTELTGQIVWFSSLSSLLEFSLYIFS